MSVMRKCVCCGKEYEFCPNCGKKSQPLWMVSFCSETCKDLFNLVSAYNIGRVGKVAVQTFVTEHNITGTDYSEPIRKVLAQVEVKAVAPKKEMPKVEPKEPEKEVATTEAQPDSGAFARSRRAKKRRHKQFGYGIN